VIRVEAIDKFGWCVRGCPGADHGITGSSTSLKKVKDIFLGEVVW
jgi:hypothetical protein